MLNIFGYRLSNCRIVYVLKGFVLMRRVNRKMDSNFWIQRCRLCLETGAALVNIFGQFEDSTIASVLATHFWFQINKDDGMPEWVCETCWTHTKTFHHFYKRLELRHQNHLIDEVNRERDDSPVKEALEADFVGSEHGEEMEIAETTDDTQIQSRESSCDGDVKDNSCDPSAAEQTDCTDDEEQPIIGKPLTNRRHFRSERKKQDEEIRSFFKMTCDICGDFEFDSYKTMRIHFRRVHKRKSYLTCCGGKKYQKRRSMLDHIQFHLNPQAHRCDQCGKVFSESKTLQSHIKSHLAAHICSLCSKTYASALTLKYHVRDKHSTDTGVKFHCDMCGKTYPTKASVAAHIKCVHVKLIDHVCDVCGRAYKHKNDLRNHIKWEHSILPKAHCDICGSWFKHENTLKQHFNMYHKMNAGNAKPLSCPICKKKVDNRPSLYSHIKHVHGEKKHQCTLCDKAFHNPKILKEHIAALHTGVDLYSCTYCDKTFKSNANMYKHRRAAHPVEWARDKVEKRTVIK